MNKKKTIILLVIGILIVITLSIGVTYSFMLPKVEKENNQTDIGINNCAKITLKDNDSTINLKNTYPMEEEMGLQTEPYEFTISSTCEEYTGFNLYILTYEENEISDDLIRYGITSKNDTLLETNLITKEEASDITDEEKNEINQGINKEYKKIYKVYSNNIPLKGESKYKLHIWIDEKAENDTMGESIKLGVVVKGYSREESLAEYLIKNKDNTLIYHDGLPDYEGEENSELEAGDYSYRYAGGNDVVNNYICFGGECSNDPENDNYSNLYRIIGLFDDDEDGNYNLKLIKADYATEDELGQNGAYKGNYNATKSSYIGKNDLNTIPSYYWTSINVNNNDWQESELYRINLNDVYLNYIKDKENNKWFNIIENHKWITAGNEWSKIGEQNAKSAYIAEIVNNFVGTKLANAAKTLYAKVGLMYVNDYYYGASSKFWIKKGWDTNSGFEGDELGDDYHLARNDNWLYLGLNEWTITRASDSLDISFYSLNNGIMLSSYVTNTTDVIARPVIYLKNTINKALGDGTIFNPFHISI